MKLDKRIKTITDIQSVTNGCHDWEFMTKKGYFANSIFDFKDLKRTCVYGEYAGWREHHQCFLCEFLSGHQAYFTYFLPEDSLLPEEKPEKKYRAFTLTEWINQHEIGDVIHYRSKSEGIEAHIMYMGTYHHKGKGTIVLGVASFTLDCLFEEYELEINGEWQPFGVIVEENEE